MRALLATSLLFSHLHIRLWPSIFCCCLPRASSFAFLLLACFSISGSYAATLITFSTLPAPVFQAERADANTRGGPVHGHFRSVGLRVEDDNRYFRSLAPLVLDGIYVFQGRGFWWWLQGRHPVNKQKKQIN